MSPPATPRTCHLSELRVPECRVSLELLAWLARQDSQARGATGATRDLPERKGHPPRSRESRHAWACRVRACDYGSSLKSERKRPRRECAGPLCPAQQTCAKHCAWGRAGEHLSSAMPFCMLASCLMVKFLLYFFLASLDRLHFSTRTCFKRH